ncbi:NPC1 [Cordylochernes scorpioides]|uniref:NPC1 n=1 Tax=Cordylochernes scorpioides TaxID=51811 RepID=A0ABY6KWT6_9ARAC|nr:NPC1 [Cordylochernes scorpioides]
MNDCSEPGDMISFGSFTCVYDGPPKSISSVSREIINQHCPKFLNTTYLCCDDRQLDAMKNSFLAIEVFISKCPSCYMNFRNLICMYSCDPDQHKFVKIVSSRNISQDRQRVTNASYYVNKNFIYDIYDSCVGVIVLNLFNFIEYFMCKYEKECTPEKWVEFLGSTDNEGGHSPYKINYILSEDPIDGYEPADDYIFRCDEAPPDSIPCACSDCERSCFKPLPKPIPTSSNDTCTVYNVKCHYMVIIFIFILSCILTFFATYIRNKLVRNLNEFQRVREPGFCDIVNLKLNKFLFLIFKRWGSYVAKYPFLVIIISLLISFFLTLGPFYYFKKTNDPIELWVSNKSQARKNFDFYNEHFGPFYRYVQIIIKPKNKENILPEENKFSNDTWGPVFRRGFLQRALLLQMTVENITAKLDDKEVTLNDICVKPLRPINTNCEIFSIFGYFNNNMSLFESKTYNYFEKFASCSQSFTNTRCLAPYGGILLVPLILGGYPEEHYNLSKVLIFTFIIKNNLIQERNLEAMAWEKELIATLLSYNDSLFTFSFITHRSFEDEISRSTNLDFNITALGFIFIISYITFTLGNIRSKKTFFVDIKFTIALTSVLLMLLAMLVTLGILCYIQIPMTMLILQVVPFVILGNGSDSIYILAHAYQRTPPKKGQSFDDHFIQIVKSIGPTLLLSGLAMSSAFFAGAAIEMPVVRNFSLFAGTALVINFLLLISCFLAIFYLDCKRQQNWYIDFFCFYRIEPIKNLDQNKLTTNILIRFFKQKYIPFLFKTPVRICVVLIFYVMFFTSMAVIPDIQIGLDQDLSLPVDSYANVYLKDLVKYSKVGQPLYFVIASEYNYTTIESQNKVCSSQGCDRDSITAQISNAAHYPDVTFIAHASSSWIDDFFTYMQSTQCCFEDKIYHDQCPSYNMSEHECQTCQIPNFGRPKGQEFLHYLPFFLRDVPNKNCPVAGGETSRSVNMYQNKIRATNFLTFHSVLQTSYDYTEALRFARALSRNLSAKLSENQSNVIEVFPYSQSHIFYEQYLTIWIDALKNLTFGGLAIFITTYILGGFKFWLTILGMLVILQIVINLMGIMYWWNIPLNAVSQVNLVVAMGLSVDYVSHIIRHYSLLRITSASERAAMTLDAMGICILIGVAMTDATVLLLVFAKTKVVQIFYFRMYTSLIVLGLLHSLIFLPVILSLMGSPRYEDRKEIKEMDEIPRIPRSVSDYKLPSNFSKSIRELKEHL